MTIKRTGNGKIAVVGWGRGMGHKGHMYLASSVITQAKDMKADPYFFISTTVGKDDPLFPEEKVRIYQKVFPQQAPIFQPQSNLNQALTELANMGYQGVVVVVGSDQKQAFQYLERPNKEGVPVYKSFGLHKLRVISRQETRDSSKELEGPRATPMREVLLNPDATEDQKFEVWRDAMPDALGDDDVVDFMHKAEARLMGSRAKKQKIKEYIERIRPLLETATVEQKVRAFRLLKEAVNNPLDDDDAFGYLKYFKKPEKKPVDTSKEKRFHGWDEYEKEANPQLAKKPDEVEEGRILNPNSQVLVYFRPDTNKAGTSVTNRPISLDMAERLIATYVERHKGEGYRPVYPEDFEVRPINANQYRRSTEPELAEEQLDEFAIDKPDDGDGRSKLIGSIVRLLQAGNRVDFFVPGIRGHVVGTGSNGQSLTLKRWKKPYSKVNYSLDLDSSDDNRFVLKMINPDYYQVVEKQDLNEFAPDDGDESRKFIPWNEFVDQLKQILHKDFDCKESINMNVIKAKFVPYDPMEYGPTMIYSYFERRAGRKGANGVRGQIQVGNFFKGSKPGDNQLMTGFHLLKGTEFERYFDLTFDNLYKIARIIQGNTQGRLESQQGVAKGSDPYADGYNAWKEYLSGKTNRYPKNPYPAGNGMSQWEAGAAKAAEGRDFISGSDQGVAEASFDKEAFRRHMADLEAREELRKTDPVSAKALDLRGQLPQQSKKKPEDDAMSINDPRHPNAAYTQGNQRDVADEGISRRGILKGIAGAGALGAAGKASGIAGAFPTPSQQQAMYAAAAQSNRAQAAELQRQNNAARAAKLDAANKDIERLNKINFHGGKVTPINATWDGDSDFMDVDGTKYSMASRMPIRGDEPGNMKLVSTKEGRLVYMWTRNSLKGVVGRYFYPAPEGTSQINEFAPGNGDDGDGNRDIDPLRQKIFQMMVREIDNQYNLSYNPSDIAQAAMEVADDVASNLAYVDFKQLPKWIEMVIEKLQNEVNEDYLDEK